MHAKGEAGNVQLRVGPWCRLIRFEDSMYAVYPVRLPSSQEQKSMATLMNSVRIEVGGMMR